VLTAGNAPAVGGFVLAGVDLDADEKERPRAIRTLRGWAISVLQEAGAIRECEEHGWATERADLHAREHAFDIARQDPASGVSPDDAVAEVRQVLDSIGDTCPECLPPMQATTD
jgi:hypothetical protein